MNSQTIPVVDLAPFLSGSPSEQRTVAQAVGHACETIGFFTITGHGVSLNLIRQTHELAGRFFALSLNEKKKIQAVAGMGYLPLEGENLAASLDMASPGDLKESLNLALPIDPASWPAQPSELRLICHDYIEAMTALAATLMEVFALALDLPIDFFAAKIDQARTILRLLNYPALPVADKGQMRAAAHTDYGTLTILWAEDARGLQARNRQEEWVDVIAPPEAFIINIGDLMMNWTNDRWISTLHRVIPSTDARLHRRQSIAFFHNPNPDALIECLPGCCDENHPPQYEPILAQDHLNRKIAKALGS